MYFFYAIENHVNGTHQCEKENLREKFMCIYKNIYFTYLHKNNENSMKVIAQVEGLLIA